MGQENSRNMRRDRVSEKQSRTDAASYPGRAGRKEKISLNQNWGRESVSYLRHMTTSRWNDLYERGSI